MNRDIYTSPIEFCPAFPCRNGLIGNSHMHCTAQQNNMIYSNFDISSVVRGYIVMTTKRKLPLQYLYKMSQILTVHIHLLPSAEICHLWELRQNSNLEQSVLY